MEVREGYKKTEVGVIPEDWECVEFGFILSKIGSGVTPTGGSKIYKNIGRPFVRSQNVQIGKMDLADIAYIDELTHSTFLGTEIQCNDVLLNITGASIGRSSVADFAVVGGNVNQHVCILRPIAKLLDSYYLCGYILSAKGQKQINDFQAGGNRQGLNFKQIASIIIPLPLLPEQQAIASALSDIDELISSLTKSIEKKKNIKKGAMQELLTGKKRLDGFSGEWQTVVLKNIGAIHLESVNPQKYPGSVFEVFSMPAYDNGKIPQYLQGHLMYSTKLRIMPNVILFNKLNIRQRRIWHISECGQDAICSSEFLPFYSDVADLEYLTHLFLTERFVSDFINMSSGTSNSQQRINPRDFLEKEISIPELLEQKAISQILSDLDNEIETLEQKLTKYKAIKQGMMQELLTGRIRLIKKVMQ